MFHLDLPNVYKVLNNGKFKLDETVRGRRGSSSSEGASATNDVWSQPVVVVSLFGSTWNEAIRGSRKGRRAFQLALDAFGTVSLYGGSGASIAGASSKSKPASADKKGASSSGSGSTGANKDVKNNGAEEGQGENSEKEQQIGRESTEEKEKGGIQEGSNVHLNANDNDIIGVSLKLYNFIPTYFHSRAERRKLNETNGGI